MADGVRAELVGGPWDGREITVTVPPPLTICVTDPSVLPGVLADPLIYHLQRGWQAGRPFYLIARASS